MNDLIVVRPPLPGRLRTAAIAAAAAGQLTLADLLDEAANALTVVPKIMVTELGWVVAPEFKMQRRVPK